MIDVTFNVVDDDSVPGADDTCVLHTEVNASTEFVDLSNPSSLTSLEH